MGDEKRVEGKMSNEMFDGTVYDNLKYYVHKNYTAKLCSHSLNNLF